MPWQCKLVEVDPAREYPDICEIGMMWFAPWLLSTTDFRRGLLGKKYFERWAAKRPPIIVALPGRCDFCVDEAARNNGKPVSDGWDVTGEAPLITLKPSINVVGIYHGYITNGVISDDVEGRVFK